MSRFESGGTMALASRVGARRSSSPPAWYANANQIAAFLTKANPHAWPLPMTTSMMKRHLDLTGEAVARLQGRSSADIAAYDRVHTEILAMAACSATASSSSSRTSSERDGAKARSARLPS